MRSCRLYFGAQAGRSVRTCSVGLFLRTEALRAERLEADGSRESGETAQRSGEERREKRAESRGEPSAERHSQMNHQSRGPGSELGSWT